MERTFLISDELLLIINLLVAGAGFLLFSLLLAMPKGKKLSNYLLAAFVWVISTVMLLWYFIYKGLVAPSSPFYPLWSLLFLQGPLLYFYVRALISPRFRLRWIHGFHLIPCILAAAYLRCPHIDCSSVFLAQPCEWLLSAFAEIYELLPIAVFIIYLFICLNLLKVYEKKIRGEYSAIETVTLAWLYRIIALNLVVQLVYGLIKLGAIVAGENLRAGWVRHIGEAIFLYLIVVASLRHRILFSEEAAGLVESTPNTQPKYQRSALGEKQGLAVWENLVHYMDKEQPFLYGDLKLAQLAGRVNASVNDLSQVINSYAGQNFHDYVNGYRAREVKSLIEDTANREIPLIELAMQAGFSSKNTFYKHFKKHFSITPAEYRKSLQTMKDQ